MKFQKPIVLLTISFVFVVVARYSFLTEYKPEPAAQELYSEFCQDCHGKSGRDFINRSWKLGSTKEDIERVIREGNELLGMPAYGDALENNDISLLTDYVLGIASTQKKFQPKRARLETTSDLEIRADIVIDDLETPWGMDFTSDSALLVTEREGRLWHLKNGVLSPVMGLPKDIVVKGQGGLLDIAFWEDPETGSPWVYLTYSRENPDHKKLSATSLIRGEWTERENTMTLENLETLFIATPYEKTFHHYGSRITFGQDGMLYLTCGERGQRDVHPQTLTTRPGKVHRFYPDGSIPLDNPFAKEPNAEPSIWTWGHRNSQGMFVHPTSGEIWTHEHGPKGGDEINILRKGANYGWPIITYGRNYSGTIITKETAKAGLEQPLHYWLPSIGACGFEMIHEGPWPAEWQGDLLAGSLSFEYLERLSMNKELAVVHRERLLEDIGRVRDIARSPSGEIFVAIEGAGVVYHLVPLR
jgi:glucose/arabinose dehydrogenase